jgi:hypothetical protein
MLSDDVEQTITQFIRMNFQIQRKSINHPRLLPFVFMLVHDFVTGGILPAKALTLQCSSHFASCVLHRANLSFRKTRPTKRAMISDEAYTPLGELIPNFDESSWRLMIVSETFITERGTEVLPQFTRADSTICFTFIAPAQQTSVSSH